MRHYLAPIVLAAAALPASAANWYEEMQIGPAWSNTFAGTFGGQQKTAAVKGVLIDLGDGSRALFDTETLRVVTAYKGGVHWGGTPWTGAHGPLVRVANEKDFIFNTANGPGWADESGSFEDKRPAGFGGNISHAQYKGFYRHGSLIVFDYLVHGTRVLESLQAGPDGFVRHFEVAAHAKPLTLVAAEDSADFTITGNSTKSGTGLSVATRSVATAGSGAVLSAAPGKTSRLIATLAPSDRLAIFTISYNRGGEAKPAAPINVAAALRGGERLWKDVLTTKGEVSTDNKSPWVTDTLTLPASNPWKSNLRFAGFDFIDEDSAAIATWNGDVWVVTGLKGDWSELTWKRRAAGLFEPLGLKVVDGTIYVHGRDQITKLNDLNKDGEADHFECFFNGASVSPNFHEFAFDLQTDSDGNFYFSKAAPVRGGGRGFDPIFPHHGTVLKVSKDGSKVDIMATGLRAPGGLGIGPNGEITTGENEGTNQPCCKINYITKDQAPAFFGTEASRQGLTGAPYTEPLCYLPMDVDNSSGSQVWVPKGNAKFGLKPGEMLHLSYGQSSIYRVLPAGVDGTLQGGVVKLPVKLGSSAMRARFHPDGSLYVAGFRGWQTNAASECAFQRIRHTGVTVPIPDQLEVTATGVRLRFETELDKELATDPESYSAQRWDYVRGPQYGSGEFSVDTIDAAARKLALDKESKNYHKRDNITIAAARLLKDGKTVELDLEGHKPSMSLKVSWDLEDTAGEVLKGDMHGTVRKMGK